MRILDATCVRCGWHYTTRVVLDLKGTTRTMSWAIDDGHSDLIAGGYGTEIEAMNAAQREADSRQQSVFLYDESDPLKDYVEIEPNALLQPCSGGCGHSVLVNPRFLRNYPDAPVLCSACALKYDFP